MASSLEVGLQQFRSLTIAHPHLVAARERLMTALADSPRNCVILVFGPTGVGKTTLRARVESDITASLAPELQHDLERLTVVSVEAVAPDSGNFNWRDHFKRLLEAMREPLIEYKLDRKKPMRRATPLLPFERVSRWSGAEYQYAVEQALRYRKPAAVLIDEAQHLAKMGSGRRLLDQLDVIKSIAGRTATPHVLVGAYDLVAFRNLSGQLSRRGVDVHFGRYRADRPADRAAFVNVVRTLAARLPLSEPPDLAKDWEFLYERSIGCVGILKDWLVKALFAMMRRSGHQLERRDLNASALPVSQCEKLLSECLEGETHMEETPDGRLRLRAHLGLDDELGQHPPGQASRQPRRRPGQRLPKRDAIGASAAVHAS